jgi:hypothetical protein
MNAVAITEVVAERELERLRSESGGEAASVVVRIGKPEPDPKPDGDWRCPFQITGLGDDAILFAHGVDAVQALELCFQYIGIRLEDAQARGIPLRWLGDEDLGFPVPPVSE